MTKIEILNELVNFCGNLSKEQNKTIINEYATQNPHSVGIYKFIDYYNQFSEKPIKEDQINMFFRYVKF